MTRVLAILGAGGHGRVVADCAEAAGWSDIRLFDDRPEAAGASPWPVAGTIDALMNGLNAFDGIVAGVGANADRLAWTRRITGAGGKMVTLIHPRATVSPHAVIGHGSVVFAGAVINIGAHVGQAAIINTAATVDHDCVLEDGVHVSPGAHLAGGVTVGRESWIGVGAVVRENTAIGAGVIVGAGAVLVGPVADGLTVVGNPARALER